MIARAVTVVALIAAVALLALHPLGAASPWVAAGSFALALIAFLLSLRRRPA